MVWADTCSQPLWFGLFPRSGLPHPRVFLAPKSFLRGVYQFKGQYYVRCLGTFICNHLLENLLSILLGIHLGVDFLGHMVTLMFNFLENCQTAFHKG